ncbi:MAG TPA: hypothetical protein ENN69_02315 [Spirochaetia bacterium]|nr:hypothetical protein [Spirochaetia bacterium]
MIPLTAKVLDAAEALAATHFVYTVYAGELRWLPAEKNPSQWEVRRDEQGLYFTDMFDREATWFGVFHGKRFAAAGRLVRPVNGKLEVELYQELPDHLAWETKRAEMNRLTLAAEFADSPALMMLVRSIFEYTAEHDIEFLVEGVPDAAMKFAERIGLTPLEPALYFRYSPEDPADSSVMYMDCRNAQEMRNRVTGLDESIAGSFTFFA